MSETVERERLEKENTCLRAICAKIMPCHFCGVDQIAKCPHGFPGCALMDDLIAGGQCANRALREDRASLLKIAAEEVSQAYSAGYSAGYAAAVRDAAEVARAEVKPPMESWDGGRWNKACKAIAQAIEKLGGDHGK